MTAPRTHIPVDEFLEGTPSVPRLVVADAYTIGTGPHASEDAKEASVYHITPRRGFAQFLPREFEADERIVFTGFRRILRDLLTVPVTMQEIEETDRFLATAHAGGVEYSFDREVWVRVVDECHGIIPIKIEAFLEGTTSFPYEPVVQVTAQNGFGELAGYFESKLLHFWASSERTTSIKWAFEYLVRMCRKAHPGWDEGQVQFAVSTMMHDFGDRAGTCSMESEVLGGAHLLVTPGTDTFSAAYQDWKENGEVPFGCSIKALAHRTVMGFMAENDCHSALYQHGQTTTITAHVSDTYDFFGRVTWFAQQLTGPWNEDSNLIVTRPDSGDMVECVRHVLRTCDDFGLYEVDPDTGLHMATRLRWIQGDSVSWKTMIEIVNSCLGMKWSPFASGAFGIGGFLRNSIQRDHAGTSMKLAAVGAEQRPVAKRSETPAKSSTPGLVRVVDNKSDRPSVYGQFESGGGDNMLRVWYNGTLASSMRDAFYSPAMETSSVVRGRIAGMFFNREQPDQALSPALLRLREEIFEAQTASN